MSLKYNILANSISQFYIVLLGVFMVPVYVDYMGVESYGLVAFFTMLQGWFRLLDMGLTPTLSRETSRFVNNSEQSARQLRQLVRALEIIFVCIAFIGASILILSSNSIAVSWLKVHKLALVEVRWDISLMAVTMGLRWICGIYRGAITGFERLVWVGWFNFLIATARFLLVIPVFLFWGTSSSIFFEYQLIVSSVEAFWIIRKTYQLLPKTEANYKFLWEWAPLRTLFKFSMSMAFINLIWIMTMQIDKLLLSKILSLEEYAYFSLATLMAMGIFMLGDPIGTALLPRLTKLAVDKDDFALLKIYREVTQLVAVIVIPVVVAMAFFSEKILFIWTGNAYLAHKVAPVLALYAIGNGFVSLGMFPYYLQFAKGNLRLHIIGNILFIIFLVPTICWATLHYGAIGAGFAWVGTNALYFFLWLPQTHKQFVKGLHRQWLLQDIGGIVLPNFCIGALISYLFTWPTGRIASCLFMAIFCAVLLCISVVSSPQMRMKIKKKWQVNF